MNQHEAAEVVIRILADVNSILKGFKKTQTGAKAVGVILDEVGKQIGNAVDKGCKVATDSIEQFVSTSKSKLKTLGSEFREVGREMARAMRRSSMPREGGGKGRPRAIRYGLGSMPVEKDYSRAKQVAEGMIGRDTYSVNKIGRYVNNRTGRIVKKSTALAGGYMAAVPSAKSIHATSRRTQSGMGKTAEAAFDAAIRSGKAHPMASAMSKGGQADYVAAMMATARHNPTKYGPAVQPKGKYGPTISTADRKAHQFAVDQARGMFGSYGPSRADMYGPAVQPRGVYGPHFTAAQRAAAMAGPAYYGPHLPSGGGPIGGGQFGPFISATQRARQHGAQSARYVPDQPLDEKYVKRLADARKLGGPLSVMPGILGKIAGGFVEASKKKDAFAANVFAKMPPCFFILKNLATIVYRVGAWGFQKAWSGAAKFVSILTSLPGLVMRLGSSVSSGFSKISNSIRNSVGNLQSFGTKLRTAGIYTTAAVTAPLVMMANNAVASGSSFDQAMTETVARAGLNKQGTRKVSAGDRKMLEQGAIDLSLSGKIGFSPTELAQGYTELAAAGVESMYLLGALPKVAYLAQAGEMDLAKTTNALTTTMGALGITTDTVIGGVKISAKEYQKQMGIYSDVMVTVANMTQASVESVSQSMTSDAGPAARAYGMGIQELGATLGVYAEKGIKGAKAGNMLGRALRLVTSSFSRNRGAWEEAGIEIADAQGNWLPFNKVLDSMGTKLSKLSKLERTNLLKKLGLRDLSQKALEPLLGAGDAVRKLMKEMESGGQTAVMAGIQMEAFNKKMQAIFWNPIEAFNISVFKIIEPYLLAVAEAVGEIAKEFTLLAPETKKSIILILAALASIGPILLGIGTLVAVLVAGFSLLGFILAPIAMLLSPIGLVLASVIALGVMWLSTFKIDLVGVWNRASIALNQFAAFAMGFVKNFGPNMMIMWDWLKEQLARFSEWSKETLDFLGITGIKAADGMMAAFGNLFMQAFGFIANFKENMTTLFNWLNANWAGVRGIVGDNLLVAVNAVAQVLIGTMAIVGQELLKAMVPVGEFFWNLFKGIGLFIIDTLRGITFNLKTMSFEMLDRPGLARDKRDNVIKEWNKSDALVGGWRGMLLSDKEKKEYANKSRQARAQAEVDYQAELRGMRGGEALINQTLKTATDAMGNANKIGPAQAIWNLITGEKDKAAGLMQALPQLPGLNLQRPVIQAPNLQLGEPNKDLFIDEAGANKNVAANNTKLFEMMVTALQSMNQNDTKKPKIVLAPAGLT